MIPRALTEKLLYLSKKYPIITLTGPRQSGKTTLVKSVFPKKPYVSLENPDLRQAALNDPRGFLNNYPDGAIFDEIQRTPNIFSYLQEIVDTKNKAGMFILTGSQHFLLLTNISQTLAGRAAILNLLPLSHQELLSSLRTLKSIELLIFKGLFPRLYDKKIKPQDWYPSYIQTYIERDIRLIKNIDNLQIFQRFMKMCAARTGQLLNLSSIANDCGISHNTVKSWISILEASFVIYLLYPHHNNFNKRLVKMPKLYFLDTGLACSLLEIEKAEQLKTHPLRGNLFETFVINEMLKCRYNQAKPSNLYFWRDKTGHEIDCLIDKGTRLVPVEIKSGKTINQDYFKGLNYFSKLTKKSTSPHLIYGGDRSHIQKDTTILGWENILPLLKKHL